jgi:hypothetical protein
VSDEVLPLTAEGDQRKPGGDIAWLYRHNDGHLIAVVNPRIEADGDEDGIHYSPTFDYLEVDGERANAEQEDEYTDIIMKALRYEDFE